MRRSPRAVAVQAFRGFGTARRVCVTGRVTVGREAVHRPREPDRRRRLGLRIRDALRLAVSRRVTGARVRIHCSGVTRDLAADPHGYFSTCLDLPASRDSGTWREYRVEVLAPAAEEAVAGRGEILIAGEGARRVIVSDIDDTVMRTGVANKAMMLWRLFTQSAHDRAPFPGIGALYRGLHRGPDGDEENPAIYVSRSPWSIYPVLEEFFQRHAIPVGPVLELRDWGISLRHPFPRRARGHKRQTLERVFEVFGDLPVVLIGDSGQHDPEVYAAMARRHRSRVAGIYIRDLELSGARRRELDGMGRTLAGLGTPMVTAVSTEEMARDMAERGWIPGAALAEVRAESAEGVP